MAEIEYLDFDLEIGPGKGLEYSLVARSPAGEARAVMRFPFDELALERYADKLQIALLRTVGGRRSAPSEEERTVQEFGQALFDALLTGEVRGRYGGVARRSAQDLMLLTVGSLYAVERHGADDQHRAAALLIRLHLSGSHQDRRNRL